MRRVRPDIGIVCAIGAVGLGIVHLALAGASPRAAIVNGAALAIGLLLLVALRGRALPPALTSAAAAAALVGTALAGAEVEGVARWVRFGSLLVQPAMVLLPAMVVAFARARSRAGAGAIGVAALALALQPDRGMAGALAATMVGLALTGRDRATGFAAIGALAGFVVTLGRPDTLPPEPFVEGVVVSSFAAGPMAGFAAAAGLALLVTPAVVGVLRQPEARDAHFAFGAVWLGVIAAAALGNYPTPVVGYGGSAILGYLLSLAALPRIAAIRARRYGSDTSPPRTPPSIQPRAAAA